ncbi:hypothetical protein ASPCAL07750 [Aspergillus calidoustus]|uniref:Zn(2)-C6 fungal-type domain-containing protein n=1 Tax=Aspergillus calidoustus TaxID=454130 RepID=A0A0U5GSN4_ASPCI|nr:hypothetical protein ASPCAL07750 [Aspergillus calidoustus]
MTSSTSERKLTPESGPVSGEDLAHNATTSRQAKPKRRNRVILSCLECRRRKMKCDREEPCTPCGTSGLECVYVANPKDGDAAFRQQLVEMKDAKDALDGSLRPGSGVLVRPQRGTSARRKRAKGSEVSSDESDSSAGDAYLPPTPLAVQDAAYGDGVDDDVIDDLGVRIGRMRLGERIGGLFRPRIADEVSSTLDPAPQGRLLTGMTMERHHQRPSPEASISLIFGQTTTSAQVTDHIPPRHIADWLLDQYWIAVHPVARVVHRPSFMQRYETLWECVGNGQQVSASLVAIVSAILLSAALSMADDAVLEAWDTSCAALETQLKIGTEHALTRAHVLQSTRLEVLQAFVTHMLATSVAQITRAHSVLSGMLVRQAECMGLHRDPTEFGFSLIESHVRRLIWYQVCYLDLKTSEVQGPRAFIHHDGYTTQLPLDMALLNKGAVWNDLILSMIRFECQEMQRRCYTHRNRVDLKRMTLTKAVSKIDEFRVAMDAKYGPYINGPSQTPMQKMSSLLLKLWVSLLYILPLHRYMNSVTYRVPDRLRQIVLMKGTEALEAAVALETEEELKVWAWYAPAYQQYHTAFLLLVEVFNYPRRREANRIWRCLEFIFAEPLAKLPPFPFVTTNPTATFDEIIERRAVKARYLLTMISDQMRAYHAAKQSKLPVTFNESMIVVTPQIAGDESDPRMPLNYAHGEPEGSAPTARNIDPTVTSNQAAPPTITVSCQAPGDTSTPSKAYARVPHYNTTSALPSSSGSSPWGQPSYSDRRGVPSDYVQYPSYATSASQDDEGLPTDIDPQLLEIDWELWDIMFPPQANDGNLDLADSYEWDSQRQGVYLGQGSFSE